MPATRILRMHRAVVQTVSAVSCRRVISVDGRSHRGRFAVLAALLILSACSPTMTGSHSTDIAEQSRTSEPTAPGSPPSAMAEASPRPTDEATPPAALVDRVESPELVLRLEEWVLGIGEPYPAPPLLTVLDDGRVITRGEESDAGDLRLVVRTLTPAGLARLGDEVRGTGLFEVSADHVSRSLSDPEPLGAGRLIAQFTYGAAPNQVVVRSSISAPAGESPSEATPEVQRLTELRSRLLTLESWLPVEAWIERGALPYLARGFMIRVQPAFEDLEPGAVTWPLREWIETLHGTWNRQLHCGVITLDEASAIVAELHAAGLRTVDERPISGLDGVVWTHLGAQDESYMFELVIVPLTPDGAPSCW